MDVIDVGAIVWSQHNPYHNPLTPGSETIF